MTSKALKLKKKDKDKENQSPDPAIFGRIRTRDPDPDHFGPDFDSGSGCGSVFTDLQSGSPQKHGLVLLILHFIERTFLRHGSSPSIECASYRLLMGGTV